MYNYVALLRGINVGGKNSLPMKELAAILEELGAANVKTYIQSGNVVFCSKEKDSARLAKAISAAIKKSRGFEPHILLLTLDAIEKVIAENPFPEAVATSSSLHVGFLDCAPKEPELKKLESLKIASERFELGELVFYLHAPDGIGRSKLAAGVEKVLGVPMTFRNWRTVCKIRELASE